MDGRTINWQLPGLIAGLERVEAEDDNLKLLIDETYLKSLRVSGATLS